MGDAVSGAARDAVRHPANSTARPGPLRRRLPPWLGRDMALILGARAAMSVGRAVASIVTALYLDAIGFGAVAIGALFVAVTIASALMSTTIGLVADRFGRRPFLIVVPLVTASAGVVFSFSRTTVVLVLAAAIGSFGRGAGAGGGSVGPYQPAESAFVAELVDGQHRAAAFSWIAFASAAGALIGGLATGLVHAGAMTTGAAATAAFRPAYLLAAGLAAVAGLIAIALREPARGRPGPDAARASRPKVRWPRRSWPVLWRFWVTNATNGLGIGLFGPFVSYWFFRRYGASPGTIGLLFAAVNLASLVSTVMASRVARRLGTVPAIITVRALGGLMLVPMVLMPTFWAAGTIYLVRMMVQRVGAPLRQSFTQDMADPTERASVAALASLPSQGTMAGGQFAAGWLFDNVALSVPFMLTAVFQVANAGLYWVLFIHRPPTVIATAGPPGGTGPPEGTSPPEGTAPPNSG